MGMRGVVISDIPQDIVAYIIGAAVLIGLIIWLVNTKGIQLASLPRSMFALPGLGSKEGPLYVFRLILTGTVGG